jgi:drug/metabolite transporter (DMT)-like permease
VQDKVRPAFPALWGWRLLSGFAFSLVITASFIHAGWNYLSKQSGGGIAFLWLASFFTTLIYAPLVAVSLLTRTAKIGMTELALMVVSALIHTLYSVILQTGYRVADLSLVYPLARGTGPALSTLGAVILFRERPSPVALSGLALVVIGIFIIAGGPRHSDDHFRDPARRRRGCIYGLLTGACIAAYTLWDKHAVAVVMIPPLLLDYVSQLMRLVLLSPPAVRNRIEIRREWAEHRRQILGVAVLNPLSFILVLTAMIFTPVSYVAPARELSILIGVAFGSKLLGEGQSARRWIASVIMLLGILALAAG